MVQKLPFSEYFNAVRREKKLKLPTIDNFEQANSFLQFINYT
jgi:hypothetical protein